MFQKQTEIRTNQIFGCQFFRLNHGRTGQIKPKNIVNRDHDWFALILKQGHTELPGEPTRRSQCMKSDTARMASEDPAATERNRMSSS